MKLELAHAWALALLAAPALLAVAWVLRRRHARPALRVPTLAVLAAAPRTLRSRTTWVPLALRALALVALAAALARPRGGEVIETATTEGIDIMIAVDTSGSMLAEDMVGQGGRLNRLEAAKEVAAAFVRRRTADRIGLVSFDDISVPRCPPTLDYGVLLDLLQEVRLNDQGGRTAIGTAIGSCINRLRSSTATSRVVILVTDGRNNAGRIGPHDAAALAHAAGIRVYTIGVGTRGLADYPVRTSFGRVVYQKVQSDVDEETLRDVAEATGGAYFRATDRDELERIFEHVDRLERSEIEVERHVRYREAFTGLVHAGAVLACLALLFGGTAWRTFP